jgi:hypothetical protein
MAKDCGDIRELIATAIYGPLNADELAGINTHLASCAPCRRERDELERTVQLLGQPEAELSDVQGDAFSVAIRRKIGSKTHRRLPIRKAGPHRPAWIIPASLAAAFLLAILGVFLLRGEQQPNEAVVLIPAPVPVPAPKLQEPVPPVVVPPTPVAPAPQPAPAPAPIPSPPPPAPAPAPIPVEKPPTEPPAPAPAPVPIPPSRETVAVMAQVDSMHGEVAVQTDAGKIAAKPELGLIPGQEIQTGSKSSDAVIKISDGTRIHLSADSTLRLVSDLKGGAGRGFLLSRGTLRAEVAKQPAGAPMIFATPNADARVLGTELLLFAGADSTRLEVRSGKVRLTRREDGLSVDVAAGSTATAPKTGAFAAKPGRAFQGLQALYLFHEGQGNVIHDVSGSGAPLDLRILKARSPWAASGFQLEGNPMIKSDGPATRLIDACRKTQELTLEAWVVPARAALDFEGAILSLSTDVQDRNFALAQNAGSFEAALRSSATDGGGRPALSTAKGSCETRLSHLIFTRSAAGQERLYVNGVERGARIRAGTFATWNDGFHLYVGNESFEERPWNGGCRLMAVYSLALSPAEVARNFKAGIE